MSFRETFEEFKKGLKLKGILDKAVADERFFPQGKDTYCNQFALTYLRKLGYNIDPVLWDGDIYLTNTGRAFNKAITNKILQISPVEAQKRANKGGAVYVLSKISKPYNHAAIVCPTFLKYNKEKGVRVAQAGGVCGIFWISDWRAWGKQWQHGGIKYFVLEREKK